MPKSLSDRFSVSQRENPHLAESVVVAPEWLDAHRWLVFTLLTVIPLVVTLPVWIFGLSADPIWSFSGVVQKVGLGVFRGGLPFCDPHVGWTSQAIGHLASQQWLRGTIPWWDPYLGIGLPLAGEMQPGAFFLPFVFLLLLRNGFLWLRIAMQLIAGFSTYALLRELKLGRLAALTGGLLFELCGTFAWTRGPDSFFCTAAFLPLLLLGIEQVSNREQEHRGTLWIALALGFSLLAGFPETAYIDGLLALIWTACRFATLQRRWRFLLRVSWGCLLGVLLAAPLLMAFQSLLRQSPALQSHSFGLKALSPEAFPMIFLPYAYGNHPGNSGLNGWSDLGGYAGILVFFFALLGLRSKKPLWLRVMLIAWVTLAWAKTFGIPPVMSFMNHIPFLLQTAFYRYSPPSWELCLILLAAFGIENLRYQRPRVGIAAAFALAIVAGSIAIAWPWRAVWGWQQQEIAAASKYLLVSAAWAAASLVCTWFLLRLLRGEARRWAVSVILAVNAAVFFIVPLMSSARAGFVDRPAIGFLQNHLGLSRFHTVAPIQPNYSAYFRIASIDYDYFPVPANYLNYVTNRLFPPLPKTTGIIFWPAWSWYGPDAGLNYLWKFLPAYESIGVKYVVADSGGADSLFPQAPVPTANQGNVPLALLPGQHVQFAVPVPTLPTQASDGIRGAAIFLGNYGNASDGDLNVRACVNGICAEGSRSLSQSKDNSFFYVPFNHRLIAAAGTPVTVQIAHVGGSRPVALWIWPDLPGRNQNLLGPDGKLLPGRAVRVSFSLDLSSGGLPRVYHDSLVDIFELPHPAPYYSVASGGPCHLDARSRDSLHAVCSAPAVLVRRGLYMPGWHASRGSKRFEARPYDKIFQSYGLPAGDSRLQFAYVPPHAAIAAWGSLFAAAALLVELMFDLRRRRPLKTHATIA